METKKKVLFITLTCIIIAGIFFVTQGMGNYTDVPQLSITYMGGDLEVGQGSYRWNSGGELKDFTVESYAKVISQLGDPKNIVGGSELELHFDYQPESVALHNGSGASEGTIVKNNKISVAKESGLQIYFLDCEWQEGTVTYVVAVKVLD